MGAPSNSDNLIGESICARRCTDKNAWRAKVASAPPVRVDQGLGGGATVVDRKLSAPR